MKQGLNELKSHIEKNKTTINSMLSGADNVKRINDINWLRNEISYSEPYALLPISDAVPQSTNMKNIGETYDYIMKRTHPQKHKKSPEITINDIGDIHYKLCKDTELHQDGGRYRTTVKILDMIVNEERFYAPDSCYIPSQLGNIVYDINNKNLTHLSRALNAHYELIMLQPFEDYNKRTARMIMNWILLRGGYTPIIFNKKSDKQDYVAAIKARANGNHHAYNEYMYKCMLRTQRQLYRMLTKSQCL